MTDHFNKCETCRFWSEMCAQSFGCEPIEALCLSTGPKAGKFVRASDFCPSWRSNHHGAIDAPPNYGEFSRAAYDKEDTQK